MFSSKINYVLLTTGGKSPPPPLPDKLLELLEQLGLSPKLIRGQVMDGCSVMSGATDKVQGPCLNIAVSCNLRKTKERCSSLGLPTEFERGRIRTRRAPFNENPDGDDNDPATDAKEKFKIDVY